jgi:hypothetical protein
MHVELLGGRLDFVRRFGPFAVACALVLACSSAALAADGTVTGTITGLPTGSAFSAVTAVNEHGAIGGVATADAAGHYSVKLAPGTWLIGAAAGAEVEAGAKPAPTAFTVLRVRAGRHVQGKPLPLSGSATTARTGMLPPHSVVTVTTIGLADLRSNMIPGNSFDFAPVVENDLYRLCSSHGIELVDTATAFKKFAAQESGLSASGRLSTPFVYRPTKPEYGVYTHDQVLEDGYVKMGLFVSRIGSPNIFDVVSGHWGSPDRDTPIPSDADVLSAIHAASRNLAAKMCGG